MRNQKGITTTVDALLQELECQRIVIRLLAADALKFKTRCGVVTVELDLRRAARLGIDLAQAIACTTFVFPENEVVLKGGQGSSKSQSSGSRRKSKSLGPHESGRMIHGAVRWR